MEKRANGTEMGCIAKRKLIYESRQKRAKEGPSWRISTHSHGVMRRAEIMLACIRWYLRYTLSYRDLEELMLERGAAGLHHY